MSERAKAVRAALAANEGWSPAEPIDIGVLTARTLLPEPAYAAAADLGIEREDADAIATVFFEHLGSYQKLDVETVRRHPSGAAAGFSMFWGYLTAIREAASS